MRIHQALMVKPGYHRFGENSMLASTESRSVSFMARRKPPSAIRQSVSSNAEAARLVSESMTSDGLAAVQASVRPKPMG